MEIIISENKLHNQLIHNIGMSPVHLKSEWKYDL